MATPSTFTTIPWTGSPGSVSIHTFSAGGEVVVPPPPPPPPNPQPPENPPLPPTSTQVNAFSATPCPIEPVDKITTLVIPCSVPNVPRMLLVDERYNPPLLVDPVDNTPICTLTVMAPDPENTGEFKEITIGLNSSGGLVQTEDTVCPPEPPGTARAAGHGMLRLRRVN